MRERDPDLQHQREMRLAYALVAIGLIVHAMASHQWLLLSPVALGLALHPLLGKRVTFELNFMNYLLLALPIALLTQVHEIKTIGGDRFNMNFYAGLYCLLVGVAKLYAPKGDPTRIARILLATALAVTCSAAGLTGWLTEQHAWYFKSSSVTGRKMPGSHMFFIVAILVFGVAALVAMRRTVRLGSGPDGPRRRALYLGVGLSFALALGVAAAGALTIRVYYHQLGMLYIEMSRKGLKSGRGFSDHAMLGSVMSTRADEGREIAITVFAQRRPGYLRGKAFTHYQPRAWTVKREPRGQSSFEVETGRFDFPDRPQPADDAEPDLSVHPKSDYEAVYFLPLRTSAVVTTSEKVEVHPGNILRSAAQPTARGYSVHLDPQPVRNEGTWKPYMLLPKDEALRAALQDIIKREKLEGLPPSLTVRRIADYFERAYEYKFGIKFHGNSDPLTQFLTEKTHGHCELFASAGALLLRELGIASRYVTGFVCDEKSPLKDDMWIARNRYAHAWVEYYTSKGGWELAEFTPSAGLPNVQPSSGAEAYTDWIKGLWEQVTAFARRLPQLILEWVKVFGAWLLGAWYRIGVLFLLIGFYLFRGKLRPEASERIVWAERTFSDELAAQRERFLSLEAELAAAGVRRREWETVLEYAARVEDEETRLPAGVDRGEAVAFLRAYALARYAPEAVA